MISLGNFLVVLLAVAIVVTFFVTARHFIRRAEQLETSEDPADSGSPAPPAK